MGSLLSLCHLLFLAVFSVFCFPLMWHKIHTVGPLPSPHSGPCLTYSGCPQNICGTNVRCFCLFKTADLFAYAQSLLQGKFQILEMLRIEPRATPLKPSQNNNNNNNKIVVMGRPGPRLGGGSGWVPFCA